MRPMEKVEKIKADIAALPKEYRALFQAEQAWASKNPILYALALVGGGAVLMGLAVLGFRV